MNERADDPIDAWVTDQLTEPWPLSDHQLDVLRRALAPAAATTRQCPVDQLPTAA